METGGLLGPRYSFADELKTPSEIGVGRGGGISDIMRSVAGINYYVDAIGFGQATMMAKNMDMHQQPLGIRFFIKNGLTCDNGADMYEYISSVPNGLPGRVGAEVEKTMGVKFRGLAPGIVEDAAGALNPLPLLKSVAGTNFAKCKKVTLPVGDLEGNIASRSEPNNVWITEEYKRINGLPHQTRWIYDSTVSSEEYYAAPKTQEAGVVPETEGFCDSPKSNQLAAGLMFAALLFGIILTVKAK